MRNFKLFLSINLVFLCFLLAVAGQAQALIILNFGDSNYVGQIIDGIPSSETLEVGYINDLITLDPGDGNTVIGTETYNRTGSPAALTGLPTAVITGNSGNLNTAIIPAGYEYVLGKYDGSNPGAGSYVWYMGGGFTDAVALPATSPSIPGIVANGYGLSHGVGFNPGTSVPEPATMLLVGSGLIGLVGVTRRIKKVK